MQTLSLRKVEKEFTPKIVYTPLHGTGRKYVAEILKRIGVTDLVMVKEQELPDSDFTTCPYPNPEEKEALNMALQYAQENNADMVLATDPDADRVGVAVREESGEYRRLTGNENGYSLSARLVVSCLLQCRYSAECHLIVVCDNKLYHIFV